MLETGGLRLYKATGITVDKTAVKRVIPKMHNADKGPNTNKLTFRIVPSVITELSNVQSPQEAAVDNAKQIRAIMSASDRKILNTSAVRAPIARRMPISLFL